MDKIIYIVWETKSRRDIIFEVSLKDLTPEESKNWMIVHNNYMDNDTTSALEKDLIQKLEQELWNTAKYRKLQKSKFEILRDTEQVKRLFIFTGE